MKQANIVVGGAGDSVNLYGNTTISGNLNVNSAVTNIMGTVSAAKIVLGDTNDMVSLFGNTTIAGNLSINSATTSIMGTTYAATIVVGDINDTVSLYGNTTISGNLNVSSVVTNINSSATNIMGSAGVASILIGDKTDLVSLNGSTNVSGNLTIVNSATTIGGSASSASTITIGGGIHDIVNVNGNVNGVASNATNVNITADSVDSSLYVTAASLGSTPYSALRCNAGIRMDASNGDLEVSGSIGAATNLAVGGSISSANNITAGGNIACSGSMFAMGAGSSQIQNLKTNSLKVNNQSIGKYFHAGFLYVNGYSLFLMKSIPDLTQAFSSSGVYAPATGLNLSLLFGLSGNGSGGAAGSTLFLLLPYYSVRIVGADTSLLYAIDNTNGTDQIVCSVSFPANNAVYSANLYLYYRYCLI